MGRGRRRRLRRGMTLLSPEPAAAHATLLRQLAPAAVRSDLCIAQSPASRGARMRGALGFR
eukprot:353299-Chlamydomonas_euryale.AAC.4